MGQESPLVAEYSVNAFNYATDSENRMHNDDTAPKYGFRGGLVPGVGVYGYMAPAMAEALGHDWLARGRASVRFLKPVYDGERVKVAAAWEADEGGALSVELLNGDAVSCAVATAEVVDSPTPIDLNSFSDKEPPPYDDRHEASLEVLPVGADLGAFHERLDGAGMTEFSASMCVPFADGYGACHPAYYLALANDILVRNVVLGPWIHAGSEVQHFAAPAADSVLRVQGRVVESFERKGHEMVVLDVAISSTGNAVATVRHTAIVRPRVAG